MPRFDRHNPLHLKIAALVLATPAIAMLLLFTFGEAFGGDLSGLAHLLQLLPLAAVILGAWRLPRLGGVLLVAVSVALGVVYPFAAHNQRAATVVIVELLFFAPPLLSGLLFLAAARAAGAARLPRDRVGHA